MINTMNFNGVTSSNWKDVAKNEVASGIFEGVIWQGDKGKRTLIYEFKAGAKFPGLDRHDSGPEQVYVISGIFNDGQNDHAEGSFINNPKGSAHVPQSEKGCVVLVSYPEG